MAPVAPGVVVEQEYWADAVSAARNRNAPANAWGGGGVVSFVHSSAVPVARLVCAYSKGSLIMRPWN